MHDPHLNPTSSDPPFQGSRRSFLQRSLASGAIAVPAAVLTSSGRLALAKAPQKIQPARQVDPSRRLSHDRYHDLYPGWGGHNFREIQQDEDTHVAFLLQALGSSARPKPTFIDLTQPNFTKFVQLSQTFENTGVGAYQGAAPFIQDKGILADAASIAFVEAYHSGFLNTLQNQPIVPGGSSFSQPLTFAQVAQRLSPFIVSLNDPNGLFPIPDPANPATVTDVNILNFALIAEYLEREFYDLNVPRFYS